MTFHISGDTESTAMNDALINANSTDAAPEVVGSAQLTVLWVNISQTKAGQVSHDHEKRANIANGWGTDLGLRSIPVKDENEKIQGYFIGYFFEFRGEVKPSDFSTPIIFNRDGETEYSKDEKNFTRDLSFSGQIGEAANDTTIPEFRDDNPDKIFDWDAPGGTVQPILNNSIMYRGNFREFATCDGIRCSDVSRFNVEVFGKIVKDGAQGKLATTGDLNDGEIQMYSK